MKANKKQYFLYVALFKSSDDVYLLMTDDIPYQILGFKSLQKGLNYFTDAYNANHDRSYEASMSACINFISFAPRIARFRSIEELKSKLLGKGYTLNQLSHVSGYYKALSCKAKTASNIYENAVSPELITPKKHNI
jgi:hypothetical protein